MELNKEKQDIIKTEEYEAFAIELAKYAKNDAAKDLPKYTHPEKMQDPAIILKMMDGTIKSI